MINPAMKKILHKPVQTQARQHDRDPGCPGPTDIPEREHPEGYRHRRINHEPEPIVEVACRQSRQGVRNEPHADFILMEDPLSPPNKGLEHETNQHSRLSEAG